jgi:ATP-dependent exoDNAse (exonuclease V) alpha subunit
MLVRNLITTALTRARRRVIVFSVGDALERGIRNNRIAERHTYLKERIAEEIRKEEAKKETA